MKQEVQVKQEWNPKAMMEDLQNTQKMCHALMQTPHYKRMGDSGIFAIVQKAKALNVNPIDALNGGMYCVNGKVEMSSYMMNELCRRAGHSITKDKRSDDTICILHGKRGDNGDTWSESFSIEDAKRAGIYKNTWEKFPRNMLFARALSNLARQLFPDAIKGCYVEGEISSSPLSMEVEEVPPESLNEEQIEILSQQLELHPSINERFEEFMKNNNYDSLKDLPAEVFDKVMSRIEMLKEKINEEEKE